MKGWIAGGVVLGLIAVALPLIISNPSVLQPQLISQQSATVGSAENLSRTPSQGGDYATPAPSGGLQTLRGLPIEEEGAGVASPLSKVIGGGEALSAPATIALNISIILTVGGGVGVVAFTVSRIRLKRSPAPSSHG